MSSIEAPVQATENHVLSRQEKVVRESHQQAKDYGKGKGSEATTAVRGAHAQDTKTASPSSFSPRYSPVVAAVITTSSHDVLKHRP